MLISIMDVLSQASAQVGAAVSHVGNLIDNSTGIVRFLSATTACAAGMAVGREVLRLIFKLILKR